MLGVNAMANQINNDLDKINMRAYQWKMIFNPAFTAHPRFVFSNNPVHETSTQMHLEMFFDVKLKF